MKLLDRENIKTKYLTEFEPVLSKIQENVSRLNKYLKHQSYQHHHFIPAKSLVIDRLNSFKNILDCYISFKVEVELNEYIIKSFFIHDEDYENISSLIRKNCNNMTFKELENSKVDSFISLKDTKNQFDGMYSKLIRDFHSINGNLTKQLLSKRKKIDEKLSILNMFKFLNTEQIEEQIWLISSEAVDRKRSVEEILEGGDFIKRSELINDKLSSVLLSNYQFLIEYKKFIDDTKCCFFFFK